MARIVYPKKLRESASSRDLDLFAIGYAEAKGKGSSEFMGPMAWELGEALFYFSHKIHTGMNPAEAFAATDWPKPEEKP